MKINNSRNINIIANKRPNTYNNQQIKYIAEQALLYICFF